MLLQGYALNKTADFETDFEKVTFLFRLFIKKLTSKRNNQVKLLLLQGYSFYKTADFEIGRLNFCYLKNKKGFKVSEIIKGNIKQNISSIDQYITLYTPAKMKNALCHLFKNDEGKAVLCRLRYTCRAQAGPRLGQY